MTFIWSTLHVRDMETSLRFYREVLGLEPERQFQTGDGRHIAFLDSGSTKIELICDGTGKAVDAGKDISLGFAVPSLDDAMRLLQQKGIPVTGPIQPNPSVRFVYVTDPDGMKIQLVENR